ncbi:MAG TPA: tyrosine--tRNA ligase [Flavobacteriales bacterium]|nr:tyrosine--tRNA ligase [Flavobacteriales bacterium]HRE73798.1 tyrosine--tRNA ligase [Flavobacteriales bacterium]HRE95700.1 tyrosine--tRNA ligase [Flavobacteriales bacterium]HRJ34903.1 tyrosine--tRNA ligase [Flavobacteriales bacterium]HRJ39168.1 tyrosine--tRNA ligase [Flavobacteriales bacterium]
MKNFIEELRWRGMLHDVMPGTEELLNSGKPVKAYIGFDPTADSLGVGNLVQVMTLVHYQRCGHQPIALVGGATGLVGDPSGKSQERNLLTAELLQHNLNCQRAQLEKFLDFSGTNAASIVNNYDWFSSFSFLDFIRDVGKHITVNYMMAKDSVKKRITGEEREGMSFTEFTYQLIQGYDFFHLWKNHGVLLQMGGSDQWGNITTGTELIRRMDGGEAFALTTPLIKKADGTKFGKTESGNIWLDKKRTSAYQFYQFWLNAADADAENYIKIFSIKDKEEIEAIIAEHRAAPHERKLQKELAREITVRVHSDADYETALEASAILFGKATSENLRKLSEDDFLSVFEGVPQGKIPRAELHTGVDLVTLLGEKSGFLKSRGEARRAIEENSIALNKDKVTMEQIVSDADLISGKYLLLQRGKKNYFLLIAE